MGKCVLMFTAMVVTMLTLASVTLNNPHLYFTTLLLTSPSQSQSRMVLNMSTT